MIVVVTGASGFIGKALVQHLVGMGMHVRAVTNHPEVPRSLGVPLTDIFSVGEIDSRTDWRKPLEGADCVIHCAARAHVLNNHNLNYLSVYREANVQGTRNLAEQAVFWGVEKFIFLSSVGVYGADSNGRAPFTEFDKPAPVDAFAIAKLEAESMVFNASKGNKNGEGMKSVIVRIPLVYGAGVKGNLARMLRLVKNDWPLPLGAIVNLRSYVGLTNLVDFLSVCLTNSKALGKILHVSDGCDISTPDLLRSLGLAANKSVLLLPVPLSVLLAMSKLVKKETDIYRLSSSFQIDPAYSFDLLNWMPSDTKDADLLLMANAG